MCEGERERERGTCQQQQQTWRGVFGLGFFSFVFFFGNFVILKSWQKFPKHSETSWIYTRDRNLSKNFPNVFKKKIKMDNFSEQNQWFGWCKNKLNNIHQRFINYGKTWNTLEKNIKHELKVANSIIRMH